VATRFIQDLVISSGKYGESLQDPYQIRQGSGTETSKIFPKDFISILFELYPAQNSMKHQIVWYKNDRRNILQKVLIL
jgi:hypothetical protein